MHLVSGTGMKVEEDVVFFSIAATLRVQFAT